MEKSILEKYKKAGKIAAQVREEGKKLVKVNNKLLDAADSLEKSIVKKGGRVAFPVNISINEIAAHYTPNINDAKIFQENDIVKVDVGVHVDGYIADTAVTICLDKEKEEMKKIVEKALDNAIKIIKPGVNIGKIGEIIENTIKEKGYLPVSNLTGHVLNRYDLHTGIRIPNIKVETEEILKEGDAVAIEPFLTNGAGAVKDGGIAMIYRYLQDRPVRLNTARQILGVIKKEYKELPFATRWLSKFSPLVLDMSLRQLTHAGALHRYPTLKEHGDGLVTQAEHTVIVREKPIITTII